MPETARIDGQSGAGPSVEVCVAGIGLETCVGSDKRTFWQSCSHGVSGIRPIRAFDAAHLSCRVAGEVDFDPLEVMSRTEVRRSSRSSQLLKSVIAKALEDAGQPGLQRAALVVGAGGAGTSALAALADAHGWESAQKDPFLLMKSLSNIPAADAAKTFGIRGPVLTLTTACASSTDALGLAMRLVRSREVDVAVAAGVEAWIVEPIVRAFDKLGALSKAPAEEAAGASRPFDSGRSGMVPAEGAAAVVLTASDRLTPAAEPYGAILGASSNCDAFHPVQPRPDGSMAAQVLERCIADAGLVPEQVDLISAHGTSTQLNDVAETLAIRRAFGDRARSIPVTAPKSIFGHASGACGVIEACEGLLALQEQFIPPTINLVTPDPRCELNHVTPKGRESDLRTLVSCNFGFGGQNSAVVIGRRG